MIPPRPSPDPRVDPSPPAPASVRALRTSSLGWALATLLPLAAGVGTGLPSPLGAQDLGSRCDLVSYRIISSRETFQGARVTWLGAPSLACPDGLRIRADSAVVYEQTGRNELIGNVRFDTPERELRARNADYFERDGRLFAWGNVFLRDLERGTEVRGDTLLYLEEGPQRPEDNLTVYGGRPRATLIPEPTEPGAPPGEPFLVVANRLRFEGERFFWGDGQVEVERGDLRASSDSLAYDQGSGELILMRDARVHRGEVRASGGLLNLTLRDERLEGLRARRNGRIETEDFTLTGEDVQISLDENEEVRTVTSQGEEGVGRATLFSEEIRLEGDLIHIEEGEEGGRVIRSTGRARGETLRPEEDPSDPEPGVPDRDWIEGDEVVAHFVELPEELLPEGDEGPRYRLDLLVASGNARTLYRSPPDREESPVLEPDEEEVEVEAPRERWAISYVLADRIVVHMVEGEVERLETEGSVRGIQLEPDRGRPSGATAGDPGGGGALPGDPPPAPTPTEAGGTP